MVVAQRDLDPGVLQSGGDLIDQVQELTLLAMVGIVDPPRPEAKVAIAECRDAGIRVRMITGDHATTAAAIAGELGIEGRAITGAEFAAMSDEQLTAELDEIGVVARVAPEDKVRLVRLLKEKGNVVAMTGDGVNDAPALKTADIGVAMGITGTEVSKEAAVMILTDDNFATIVGAVSYGRTLYDNLLKYLRFQMSTLVAYIAIFIGAGIIGIANGAPLNPLQILWLNMVVDIPLAIALGFDQPARGLMARPPRPVGAPVLSRNNWIRLCVQGAVMTVGSLVAYQIGDAPGRRDRRGDDAAHHAVAVPRGRGAAVPRPAEHDLRPGRDPGRHAAAALRASRCSRSSLITALDFLAAHLRHRPALTFTQWCICVGIAASLVVVEELIKLVLRHRARRSPSRRPRSCPPSRRRLSKGAPMSFNLRHRSFLKELDFTPDELQLPAQALRRPQGRQVRRLRAAAPRRQEHRADLREDVDADPHRVRGRREGPGRARHLPGARAAPRSATRSR